MRSLIVVLLIALASTVGAGTINVPPISTDPTAQDPHLKGYIRAINRSTCENLGLAKTCTDAEAKAKDPAAVIYPVTVAGFESYATGVVNRLIVDAVEADTIRVTSRDIPELYLAATPATRAQVDVLLGVQ